jgi:hypothetical protein
VLAGAHTIAAPITLQRPLNLSVSAGATVKLTGDVTTNGQIITKSGEGVAELPNVRTNALNVNAGVLKTADSGGAASGVSKVGALTITGVAKLDLRDNKLITSTPAGIFSAGAYTGVQGEVARAYHNGAWDSPGLTTSMPDARPAVGITTIGVVSAQQLLFIAPTATGTFTGQHVTGASTIAMYTYAGDLNFDGQVDAQDYGIIDNWVQFPGTSGWANGDVNYDGVIDAADYGIIDNAIQLQGPPIPVNAFGAGDVVAVPESVSVSMLIGGAGWATCRRQRRATGRFRGQE